MLTLSMGGAYPCSRSSERSYHYRVKTHVCNLLLFSNIVPLIALSNYYGIDALKEVTLLYNPIILHPPSPSPSPSFYLFRPLLYAPLLNFRDPSCQKTT